MEFTMDNYLTYKDDSLFLQALYAEGVDNWEGFENAIDRYKLMKQELGELEDYS